jgi:hypothetical protein
VQGLKLKGKEKLGFNANRSADGRNSSDFFPKRDESIKKGRMTNKASGVNVTPCLVGISINQ